MRRGIAYDSAFGLTFWWGGLALMYVPIVTLVAYSFVARDGEILNFSFAAYSDLAQDPEIIESAKNSLIVSIASATISTLIGGAAAFAMRHAKGRVLDVMRALTLAPLVLPEVVFGIGLLMWFVMIRITLGHLSLIAAHVTFSVSYVYMTVFERARLLSQDLDDAAEDLGADRWQTFSRVHLPLLSPACMAGWMMAFTLSFDDFLISFYTAGPDVTTLPLTLYGLVKYGMSPVVFAISTLTFAVSFLSALGVRFLTKA